MTKEIRVVVNEEILHRLEEIRKYYAANNNADAIRYLINEKYHLIEEINREKKKVEK